MVQATLNVIRLHSTAVILYSSIPRHPVKKWLPNQTKHSCKDHRAVFVIHHTMAKSSEYPHVTSISADSFRTNTRPLLLSWLDHDARGREQIGHLLEAVRR